ncbi:unnamed protein product [Rotaria sp. Silwood2]|nr:unnamed protein product [Rotaria sp. Silwood2]
MLVFHNVLETTAVTPLSTIPSETRGTRETGETTLTTGFTGTESSRTEETSSGLTSVSTVEGSTPSYTVLTTLIGSTTEAVSGTTTKICEEMQAVDEAVSKKITVKPNELPRGENIKFQPTSQQGVSFDKNDLKPIITVHFDKPAPVQSVTLPRDKTPNGNVEQFEVTFYSPDGNKINDIPILSNSSPKEDKSKPAELNSTQIPSNTPVSRIEITIIHTTDDESPKGVVLDIKACAEVTTVSNATPSSATDSSTATTEKAVDEATTTSSVPGRCQTENTLSEELGLVKAESITETTKAETKVVGYIIRSNSTGWTPSSAFSSLNIDFRYSVEIGRIRITADNLKEWRLYYQSATEVFPHWIAYNNSIVLTNNEIIFPRTLNATKIRLTPNGDVENLHLEIFACAPLITETDTPSTPCSLTEWSDWTPCSRTCGIGYKTRTRNVNLTHDCNEEQLVERQSCMDRRCQCLLDEAFYVRVFQREPSDSKDIGYIYTYSNDTTELRNFVYINDTVDQGTIIRTQDNCYIVYCTADGLKLSDNQCVTTTILTTTPTTNTTVCTMQQYEYAPLKANNGQCISRESFPRERCGGYCDSDSNDQCKCCSIGTTYLQSVLFDCFVNGSKTITEEKTIQIRRIQSCSCNICRDSCSVRQYDSAPLRMNDNQCISREKVPRERCSGYCESDSGDQCTCCSVAKTYLQPIVFDCLVNSTQNVTVQRTVDIRRIQSCNCNVCSGGIPHK